jgi:hypothetical protein
MSSVNNPNTNIDATVRVFDQFYQYQEIVPANEYDAVYSYFRSIYTTAEAANNFTTALFRISANSGIPALTLLDELKQLGPEDLNVTFAYDLNGLRSPSTLLGVNSTVVPNYYAARNVVS